MFTNMHDPKRTRTHHNVKERQKDNRHHRCHDERQSLGDPEQGHRHKQPEYEERFATTVENWHERKNGRRQENHKRAPVEANEATARANHGAETMTDGNLSNRVLQTIVCVFAAPMRPTANRLTNTTVVTDIVPILFPENVILITNVRVRRVVDTVKQFKYDIIDYAYAHAGKLVRP